MMPFLWVPSTLFASATQVWRNRLQSGLTETIGIWGATQVRFVFGVPFALIMLAIACWWSGSTPQLPGREQTAWVAGGAVAQIVATALMLVSMRMHSFAVAYTYIKTEPVLIAFGGTLILGDHLSPLAWLGIAIATLGVVVSTLRRVRAAGEAMFEWRPAVAGITSGALFGLAAICFRGSILAGKASDPGQAAGLVAPIYNLVLTLILQSIMLIIFMAMFDRRGMAGSFAEWRRSFGTGLLGASSSAGLFVAFALTPAANVRTLTLIEMPAAALIERISGRAMRPSEWLAMALVVVGVLLMLQQGL
jgi:drug/metabolite transporter (DMT)-like permease